MILRVGTNIHHMILSHLYSFAMNVIYEMTIYVVLNKHFDNSYIMQFNFNYFDVHPST